MKFDEPNLTSRDVAALIGEPEATVRRWHHSGFSRHFGRKAGYALTYSARDAVGIAIARDLVNVRFPPPLAAKVARILTSTIPEPEAVVTARPEDLAMLAPEPGTDIVQDRASWRVPASTRSAITIPIGRFWSDITAKAAGLR